LWPLGQEYQFFEQLTKIAYPSQAMKTPFL